MYSFNIDSSGISSTPVISTIAYNTSLDYPKSYTIKASEKLDTQDYNFSFVCISYRRIGTSNTVYLFDNSTGMIDQSYYLQIDSQKNYIPEFNNDGSILYLANQDLYAIDLLS